MKDEREIDRLLKARMEIDSELRRHQSASEPTIAPDGDFGATLDASAAPVSFHFSPPPVVLSSRYEIVGELGKGGMGIVYRARDRETNELLALKVLRPEIANDPSMAERFKSELRLARQITHKNVCRIYDFNRIADVGCISMELVEGESLRRVLRRFGNLSIRASIRVAGEICSALREAHHQGIVHRDMKPENVMLDGSGSVKVMDFGIAQSVRRGSHDGSISGTPGYMSPEQAQGLPADARTDIYAVGLILYEMLTGELPFKGDSATALAKAAIENVPRPPREIEPSIPAHLDSLVLRCLDKDPARRFQTIDELGAALHAETPDDIEQFNIPVPQRLEHFRKRDYVALVLAAVSFIYFLVSWPIITPATQAKVEVDDITARREAGRWVDKYWHLSRREFRVSSEYRTSWYRNAVEDWRTVRNGVIHAATTARFPLFWKVEFGDATDMKMFDVNEGYVLLNREGKAVEFIRDTRTNAIFLPTYQPPAIEARRKIAEAAVSDFCGQSVSQILHSETSGGQWGAAYSISWQPLHPPGLPPVARVAMYQEEPYEIRCAASFPVLTEMPPFREMFSNAALAGTIWAIAALTFWFGVGRYFTSPLLIRRAPLALLVGLSFAWVLSQTGLLFGRILPLLMVLGFGLASGLVALIEIVTVEHRLLRFHPDLLATWAQLFRGRALTPGVPQAIVRGCAFGVILAAIQAAFGQWAEFALTHSNLNPIVRALSDLGFGIPDPTAAANAVATGVPALFVLATVLINAVTSGFIIPGFALTQNFSFYKRTHTEPRAISRWIVKAAFIAAMGVAIGIVPMGLRLAFGESMGAGIAFFAMPLLLGVGVAIVMMRYDMLTAVVTVTTLVLFTVNTTVVSMLSDIGNQTTAALFVGWAAILLLALAASFRPAIAGKIRGLRLGTS